MNCEEVEDLIAAYALGALPVDALSEIGEHLASCANHPEAAHLRAVAASLSITAPEMEPPPDLKARLMEAIGAEAAEPAKVQPRGGVLGWLRGVVRQRAVPYALAAALAVVVAVLVVWLAAFRGGEGHELLVREFGQPGAVNGHVVYDSDNKTLLVSAFGLDPLPADKSYQLWAIRGTQPASIGLLEPLEQPAGEIEGIWTFDNVDLGGVDAIAVTVEPLGGSPQPTSEPIFAAEL